MNDKNNTKLSNFLYYIYSNRWLKSIRLGLITIQPFVLAFCIILIILNAQSFIFNNRIGIEFGYYYSKIHSLTRIILLCAISYYLAIYKNEYLEEKVNPTIVAIIGLLSAIILTNSYNDILNFNINAKWVFSNIVSSIIVSEIFMFLYTKIINKITLLDSGHNYILKQSINSVLPAIIVIGILFLFKLVYIKSGVDISFNLDQVDESMNSIYAKNTILSDAKYLFDVQMFWFLGGHGGDIINPVTFEKSYLNVFCNIGGTGSTICLIIAILLYNLHRQSKDIAKLSVVPAIFNINEIIVYGLPIILNPIYIIPFVFTPVILGVTTDIATTLGLVEIKNVYVNWQIPVLINSYIATESIKGIILQITNLIIGTMIYIPFVVLSYKVHMRDELVSYQSLKMLIFSNELKSKGYLKRVDDIGQIANVLVYDLRQSLLREEGIYLEYQPQVNKYNHVSGVEALFRWKHKDLGNIPPYIAITLAEENGLIKDLGKWIIKKSIWQLNEWNKVLDNNIEMSINISSTQLEDPLFTEYLKELLNEYKINPDNLKLEITESLALGDDEITKNQLHEITSLGTKLVIDDFGVGYNPILYLKKYKISSIKIDGSLIKDIDMNEESRNIVKAMYGLCESFGIEIVSEFVENNNQKNILDSMGEGIYQGYLFSKPLPGKECLEYILQMK